MEPVASVELTPALAREERSAVECPFCHEDNDRVVDSRGSGGAIRRRRECQACGRRFTTYERAESEPRLRVIKKDGTRVAYDRAKIRQGLTRALHKRPVPTERLDQILQEVEDELTAQYDLEIPSRAIGDLVMAKLRETDQVAYVRFASVYRDFKDVSQFVEEVEPMLSQRGGAAKPTGSDGEPGEEDGPTGGD
jgi:transcriptional repressor NrdR